MTANGINETTRPNGRKNLKNYQKKLQRFSISFLLVKKLKYRRKITLVDSSSSHIWPFDRRRFENCRGEHFKRTLCRSPDEPEIGEAENDSHKLHRFEVEERTSQDPMEQRSMRCACGVSGARFWFWMPFCRHQMHAWLFITSTARVAA